MSYRLNKRLFSAACGATGDFAASASAAAQTALARHHSYTLLSQLYLQGLTPSLLPYAQAIPELAQTLPAVLAPDAAAAEHYHLFGLNLFPYASAFDGESGLLGGAVTDAVAAAYAEAGYMASLSSTAADHVGCQLAFLAFLSRREYMGWSDADIDAAQHARVRLLEFLTNHLLGWIAPFAVALQRQRSHFFASLGDLSLSFLSSHLADLTVEDERVPRADQASPPQAHKTVPEEAPGLRELAGYLTSPKKSGLSLTGDDISRLARDLHQPRGFGSRRQMLLALMEVTQRYGRIEELFSLLELEASAWQQSYDDLVGELPNLGPYVMNWAGKVDATRRYLVWIKEHGGG